MTDKTRKFEKGKGELIEVSKLVPYAKNPRKHDKNIDELCKSIERHGWTVPIIVDKENRIIAGHGRRLAAIKLGLPRIPCVVVDIENESEYLEIMLEDNKLASLSKNDKKLQKEVMELLQGFDTAIADIPGFDEEDIDKIFGLATKETIDGTGDFGEAGEIEGEVDPDARVISMTFKLPALNHKRIKDVLSAIQREHEMETLSEALIFALSSFKGSPRTIRRSS